ncbi:AraC family transcriptional regulator [Vallitalea pronyensis]|uniref:AraC family transcriptional regulator n=1 Tax=Vallitalea pronyensis TaxID=1348613 RepID=A0A8J8MMA2_9FIRM|nr:helix-turn-helix domain-containing protein [Vallitalea pronyensis]QUI24467.1 AraC family transcriptional regulator [Vallitalea pronyensis]
MNKRFLRQLLKLFIPYLSIIIFIFVSSGIMYFIAFKKIESNELKMQEEYIEQSKLVLDRRFEEVFNVIYHLKNTPIITTFSEYNENDIKNNYNLAVKLHNALQNLRFVNEVIDTYYIFYKNSKIVANTDSLSRYEYFEDERILDDYTTKSDFWDSLFDDYYNNDILSVENQYRKKLQTIPIKATVGYEINDQDATIYLRINSEKIRENMIGYSHMFDGNIFVVDNQGKVLVSLNDKYGIIENEYMDIANFKDDLITITADSEVIPYTYVLTRSSEQVFKEIKAFRIGANTAILIILLVGLMVSALLARHNTMPLIKLMDNNALLAKRVENQLPYLRMTFLEKWLKGDYVAIEEIIYITKFLKTQYVGNFYTVVVIDYNEQIDIFNDMNESRIHEMEVKRMLIHELLTEDILKEEFMHNINSNKLAVIFVADCSEIDTFKGMIKEKILQCDNILTEAGMNEVYFGIGKIYKDMSSVAISLTNGMDAISFACTKRGEKITWYEDIVINQDICYYPPELESRLYNCTRAGDQAQLTQVLRELLQKNVIEKNLNHQMQKLFINELCGTLVKIQGRALGNDGVVNEIIKTAFEKIKDMTDLEKIQYCKHIFIKVCEVYSAKREERHTHVMEKIDAFIKENFANPDFGLPIIAEVFNVSYTYLSEIIKEYKDMSFVNYLQYLRMEKARELLVETDLQVKDIFLASGYNSSNSFGKAFKRNHGVTASVYRERHRSDFGS